LNPGLKKGHTTIAETFYKGDVFMKKDMGDMTSRDIGNLVSKGLVNLGKEIIEKEVSDDSIDYGDLPSKTLTLLGKQVLANKKK
jgi:hypothetical protein